MRARLAGAVFGVWLMAAPAVLGYAGTAAVNQRVVGPAVLGASFVAIWPLMRSLRRIEFVAGVWLVVSSPFFGSAAAPKINGVAAGLLLVALSFLGGATGERFGGGWSSLLGDKGGGRQ